MSDKSHHIGSGTGSDQRLQSEHQTAVQADTNESDHFCDKMKSVYDVNYGGFDDKFATSVMFFNHEQVDFNFGFVPLQPQVMPSSELQDNAFSGSLLEVHEMVTLTGKPNFYKPEFPFNPS